MDCRVLGFPVLLHLQELLKLMSTESVMPFNYLNLCFPFLLLLSIFPRIRVISNELTLLIRWPKYWSFSFSIRPFNGYSGLISFRIDWFDFLAVQVTLKILPQHHSLKASILQQSAFLMVQLSYPHMITGKTVTLTIQTFVHKVMSLLFNMLSRFVTAFLPRSNHLLISLLQSPSTSDFGTQENKVCHCFHFFPFYLPWSDGTRLGKVSFHSNHKERQCQRMLKLPHSCTHLTR